MELSVTSEGAVTIVRPAGARLDAMAAVMFKDAMKSALEAGQARVVLDMSAVGFLDSSGLGAVVAVQRFLRQGQVLELAGLTTAVERVFRLTRMDRMFTIHAGLGDALRATA
ncbi:STAS domain-containing protein [Paragemmobacter ruber]|uniref:Anti-sigma factor antagonist n=1 Tax=Paragemmobacter ruber TaxID=1985673 RepID=A0ABW9Y5C9_9RHOB|nr:STAS domain-containing protein [Rhodobacter ruber]NBE07102.1 anti-sigma factor antagonist [Rhodobacter ruber]